MAQRSGSVSRAETVVSHYERPAVSTHHFMTVSIVCHFVVVCICCFIRSSSIFMYRGTKIASYHRGQTTCLTCQRRTTKKQRKCPILSFFSFFQQNDECSTDILGERPSDILDFCY